MKYTIHHLPKGTIIRATLKEGPNPLSNDLLPIPSGVEVKIGAELIVKAPLKEHVKCVGPNGVEFTIRYDEVTSITERGRYVPQGAKRRFTPDLRGKRFGQIYKLAGLSSFSMKKMAKVAKAKGLARARRINIGEPDEMTIMEYDLRKLAKIVSRYPERFYMKRKEIQQLRVESDALFAKPAFINQVEPHELHGSLSLSVTVGPELLDVSKLDPFPAGGGHRRDTMYPRTKDK